MLLGTYLKVFLVVSDTLSLFFLIMFFSTSLVVLVQRLLLYTYYVTSLSTIYRVFLVLTITRYFVLVKCNYVIYLLNIVLLY